MSNATTLNIHENIKSKLNYFHSIHKIPNIIFHGPSGSGKRTIVNEFINLIYDENREKEINEILKCKFIRYKPYDDDFNIFNLLNRIYLHIK
jgi:DNA polymerase III delta prime subunit